VSVQRTKSLQARSLAKGVRVGATSRLVAPPGMRPFHFHTHQTQADIFISRNIAEQGTWEPIETAVVCRLLPLFRTFVDLGANIGWYTAIAQRVMKLRSRVYAFEPEPSNFALLKANSSSHRWPWPRTTIVQAAVSDHVGRLDLHLSESNPGDHRIYPSEAARSCLSVPVTSLDAFFANKPLPPFLLKADTQGSEPRILRGGGCTLSENLAASVLILEFWPHGMAASGEDVGAFLVELAKLPHRPLLIDNAGGKLRSVAWEGLAARCEQDLAPSTQAFVDLVLLPAESDAYRAVEDLIDPHQ